MSPSKPRRARFFLAAAAVVAGLAVSPFVADALVPKPGIDLAFGGYILWSRPCSATTLGMPAWYMVILDLSAPYVPFPVVLTPASRLNLWYAPVVGNASLGTMIPAPGVCTISGTDARKFIGAISPWPLPGMGTSLVSPALGWFI